MMQPETRPLEIVEALRRHLLRGYPDLLPFAWDGLADKMHGGNDLIAQVDNVAIGLFMPGIPRLFPSKTIPCLTLRRSGGGGNNALASMSTVTIETRAYTHLEMPNPVYHATRISDIVYDHLRYLNRTVIPHQDYLNDGEAGVMVFWCRMNGGPIDTVDPDYDYPCVIRSYNLLIADPEPAD